MYFLCCSLQGTTIVPSKEQHLFVCLSLLLHIRNNTFCVMFPFFVSFRKKHFVNICLRTPFLSFAHSLWSSIGHKCTNIYVRIQIWSLLEQENILNIIIFNKISLYWSKKKGHNHLYHFNVPIPTINWIDWLFVPSWFLPNPYNSLYSSSSNKVKGILFSIDIFRLLSPSILLRSVEPPSIYK